MTETAHRAPAAQRHGDDTEIDRGAVLANPGCADGFEGRPPRPSCPVWLPCAGVALDTLAQP